MSETKFTKGDWIPVLRNDDELQTTFFGIVFGGVFLQIGSGNESRINAHLIAAAPEMYSFIEKCSLAFASDYPTLRDKANEILAKARGEHE